MWASHGIREGKWKLLLNQQKQRAELYDIEADWAEDHDLSQDNSAVVQELTKKIQEWKQSLPARPPAHCRSKLRKKHSK